MDQHNPGNGTDRGQGRAASGRHGSVTESPSQSLENLVEEVARLRLELRTLITAKVDLLRARVRRLVFWAALGAAGGVCALVLLAVSMAQLLEGAAAGLGVLLGGRLWLGRLAAGAIVLGGAVAGAWVLQRRWVMARPSILKKYARLQAAARLYSEASQDAR